MINVAHFVNTTLRYTAKRWPWSLPGINWLNGCSAAQVDTEQTAFVRQIRMQCEYLESEINRFDLLNCNGQPKTFRIPSTRCQSAEQMRRIQSLGKHIWSGSFVLTVQRGMLARCRLDHLFCTFSMGKRSGQPKFIAPNKLNMNQRQI